MSLCDLYSKVFFYISYLFNLQSVYINLTVHKKKPFFFKCEARCIGTTHPQLTPHHHLLLLKKFHARSLKVRSPGQLPPLPHPYADAVNTVYTLYKTVNYCNLI